VPEVRQLRRVNADACDRIVASLPYRFGNADGRRECARAVRSQPGLVAVDGTVAGFLTVLWHFERAAEITWMAVHARHRRRGIGLALLERLCEDLAAEGRRLLVLTVSPSDEGWGPPDGYQATRAF
jgi:ribosomal protein S18 acetylase RimI-like enzyme